MFLFRLNSDSQSVCNSQIHGDNSFLYNAKYQMDHSTTNLTLNEQRSTRLNSNVSILPQWYTNKNLHQSTSVFYYLHYLYQPNRMTLDKETGFSQNQFAEHLMVNKLMELRILTSTHTSKNITHTIPLILIPLISLRSRQFSIYRFPTFYSILT